MSDSFIVHDWPYLRRPVLISAFKGWNDAAEAASAAVQFMIDTWSARSIASLDAEEFYDFTETRPRIRLVDDLSREIDWPGVELYAHIDPESTHDLVLMVGQEPQLHWRTFVGETIAIAERLGIVQAVLLGALLADVPHTRPVRITGSTPDPSMYAQMEELGVGFSRYEGPTGMVGVLQDACNRRGMPAASLWGNVPHYITASPNPQVSVALLQHLDRLLDLRLSLRLLEVQAQRFRRRVDEAISHSPEALTYVRELEGRDAGGVTSAEGPSQLPSGPEVVRALEEYLRQQRNDEGEE